jgi:hypothetical protein
MLDAGYLILDAGCWILDAGYWMLDAGCWMLDAGCWILDAGCSFELDSFLSSCKIRLKIILLDSLPIFTKRIITGFF